MRHAAFLRPVPRRRKAACGAFPLLAAALLATACSRPAEMPELPPDDYRRIAVIGPSTAANLFAAGLGGRVVAVSDYCTVDEAAALPRIGGQLDPALERLAELRPDLVLTQGEVGAARDWCARAGIRFHSFHTDSIAGWEAETRELGRLLAAEAAFAALRERVRGELDAIRERTANDDPPIVLVVASRRPGEIGGLVVAGPASFLAELVALAGGINQIDNPGQTYLDLNEEALAVMRPERIVEFHPSGVAAGNDPRALWREVFPALPAVRDGAVHAITLRDALMPGPRMAETAAALAEAFADPPTTAQD